MSRRSAIPGFGLSLGYTVAYLSLIVLIPLAGTFVRASALTWPAFWKVVTSERVVASYKLSFGASFIAAGINVVMGLLVAWVLTRYRFPGRRLLDALVDLPFALPTAVAGIALATIYAPNGWVGQWFEAWNQSGVRTWLDAHLLPASNLVEAGATSWFSSFLPESFEVKTAYSKIGVTIAMTFIGLPFVVRTVQPVLQDLGPEIEEAASSLGASGWQTFRHVLLPEIRPALITGFALAFARAVGEYGSVVFISGNKPFSTEIAPLMIITKLDEYDVPGATAIAVTTLVISFVLLLLINVLQRWTSGGARN